MMRSSQGALLRSATATLLTLCTVAPVSAQVVTGRVLESGSGAPVSAALVELLTTDSVQVAAALSGDDGRYALEPGRMGTFVVRARRLGYRTVALGPMAVAAVHRIDIELTAEPVRLEGLVATGRPVCADGPGVGPETQRLWDLVVGALDVARVAQELDAYRFDMHTYVRDRTVDGRHLLLEGVERARESGAFVAMPIETLEDQGYVEPHRGGAMSWYMPDPEVLVSEHFLETHCFRVVESSDPTVVGLAFDPTPDRRQDRPDAHDETYRTLFDRRVVEVAGVLWVARATGALREMTYDYVGIIDPEIDHLAGGFARFEQLAGGLWIVRQWVLRMPNLRLENEALRPESQREVGGYVVDALERTVEIDLAEPVRPTQTSALVAGGGGDLVGRLVPGGVPIPLEGVVVRLSGSPWATRTAGNGEFAFRGVPPGPYLVTWWSPLLDSLGVPARGVDVQVEAGFETTAELPGPTLDFAVDHLCGGLAPDPRLGIIRVLTDPIDRGTPPPPAGPIRIRLTSADPAVELERVTVSRSGVATFCSVPTGVPLTLTVGDGVESPLTPLAEHEIRAIAIGGL